VDRQKADEDGGPKGPENYPPVNGREIHVFYARKKPFAPGNAGRREKRVRKSPPQGKKEVNSGRVFC